MSGGSDEGGSQKSSAPARLGIVFPPVKTQEELLGDQQQQQRASISQEEIRSGMEKDIPPVIRSVLELAHLTMSGHSQWLRASPGYQGGLFYQGKPYCFSSGFRDGTRPMDMDDKGNHMRLKDPLVYGTLSLPITAAYLCELHGKGLFDLHKPLVEYLPELHAKLDASVTARSILSFTRVLDDRTILTDAGASVWRSFGAWNRCAAMQKDVYGPVNRFLAGGRTTDLNGRQQREHLVQYVRSSQRIRGFLSRPLHRGRLSHFSVALLIAAVETRLKGVTFEDSIRNTFFEPAQSHGAGYGPPKLWRDPNNMFYQPTGLSLQHAGYRKPVAKDSLDNCGPSCLNASLNLYAPVEDYAKLLLLSLDAIMDAREILGCPTETRTHYDFGVQHLPGHRRLQLSKSIAWGIDFIPAAASFRYSSEHDLGCFGIASCGTRGSRLFADTLSRMLQHLFVKHVISKGVDATKPLNLDDPTESRSDTERKFRTVVKDQEYQQFFKGSEAHKRF